GSYVNLGIGMPSEVANQVPEGREIIYHSENGILGIGPAPDPGEEDPELINASKQYITILPGGSYFNHDVSFAMMRGGHLDIAVLGAYQVSANGDLANWATDNDAYPPAVGGAMDLAIGAKQVFVVTKHMTREGQPKILERCTYPLTGAGVVTRIHSDLCAMEVTERGLRVLSLYAGNNFSDVQACTEAELLPPRD